MAFTNRAVFGNFVASEAEDGYMAWQSLSTRKLSLYDILYFRSGKNPRFGVSDS
jgi:hypothetical protein